MDLDFTLETITPDASTLLTIGGGGALQLPSGVVGSRPGSATAGAMRWNTTTPQVEYYSGSIWTPITYNGLSPLTTTGDMIYEASAGSAARLAIGTSGQVLTVAAGIPSWATVGAASYSVNIGPSGSIAWSLVSGNTYNAVITHNLGTQNVVVQTSNISNNQVVFTDLITITSSTQVTIQVSGAGSNTVTVRVVILANGASIAAGGSTPSSVIVQSSGINVGSPATYTTLNFSTGLVASGSGSGVATLTTAALTGDATTSGTALTLATVNSNVGSFGSTSLIPIITVNAKGLITAVTTAAPSIAVQSNGTPVSGSPFSTINFAGTTLVATSVGSTVTITDTVQTIRTLTYFATSLDSPNNSDWVINALAPTVADPSNNALNIRQFSNTTEQGVGLLVPIPANATNITFTYKGRSASATAGTLQMRYYSRAIAAATPAAVPSWSAATNLTSVSSPANVFYQTYSYTATLASLSLTANNMYQIEFTRNVGVAGNLAFNWLMIELDISFT